MNGYQAAFSNNLKSQILGNCLIDQRTHLVGTYKNFNINIRLVGTEPQISINIYASSLNDPNNVQLNTFLQTYVGNFKEIATIGAATNNVFLAINRPKSNKDIPELINYNVEYLISCLVTNGYITCCEECGVTNQHVDCYRINYNSYDFLCDNCITRREQNFQQNKEQLAMVKPDIFKGIVGALGGSLFGILVWVIIYKLGFIAGIGGLAIAMGILFGYEKLAKHLDKKSVIICIIMMIATVWLANKIAWTIEVYEELSDFYSFSYCFENLIDILKLAELDMDYIMQLLIGLVLACFGAFKAVYDAWWKSTGYYKISKVTK